MNNSSLMKKQLVFILILSAFAGQAFAQELYLSADIPGGDHQISKQIARDKQLLEIWKDHVRTLTKERDEAYRKIRDLQTAEITPAAVAVDSESLDLVTQEKERAVREAEALRSEMETLKSQIGELETQGRKQQFAVEVQPLAPVIAPGSQKFYSDLTKSYMLQQDMIKKQKEELSRLQSESEENRTSKQQSEAAAQKDYDRAVREINDLQSQAQLLKERIEAVLSEKQSVEARILEAEGIIKGFESERAVFREAVTKNEAEIELLRQDRDRSVREAAETRLRSESFEAKTQNLENANEKISADNRQVWSENEKLTNSNKELRVRLEAETARSKDLETRFKESLARAEEQQKISEKMEQTLQAQIEAMDNKLKTNASDIQNLKENFNTLLEPLVSSFDERK